MHLSSVAGLQEGSTQSRPDDSSITALPSAGGFILTVQPQLNESLLAMLERLKRKMEEMEATIVNILAFGALKSHAAAETAMARVFGTVRWPVTWAEGHGCNTDAVAGLQVTAVAGRPETIFRHGRVVGCYYSHGGAQHCWLGGIVPRDIRQSPGAQTEAVYTVIEIALDRAGFDLTHIVRTWFYNADLLSWYPEFNRVRTGLYSNTAFRSGVLPVSTGISARNPSCAALTAAVWAVKPASANFRVEPVVSPLQCPASNYGSSFSRAIEIATRNDRHILISGTASIAPDGITVWKSDAARQIVLTMDVVEAILKSRDYCFGTVTRATAYFQNCADIVYFDEWCREHQVSLPVLRVQAGVCRDDLLFELEADACQPACENRH